MAADIVCMVLGMMLGLAASACAYVCWAASEVEGRKRRRIMPDAPSSAPEP